MFSRFQIGQFSGCLCVDNPNCTGPTYPWRHQKAIRVKDRKFCYPHTRTTLNEKNLSLIVIQPISMVTDSHRGAVGFGASWAFCSTCGKGCCTGSDVASGLSVAFIRCLPKMTWKQQQWFPNSTHDPSVMKRVVSWSLSKHRFLYMLTYCKVTCCLQIYMLLGFVYGHGTLRHGQPTPYVVWVVYSHKQENSQDHGVTSKVYSLHIWYYMIYDIWYHDIKQ